MEPKKTLHICMGTGCHQLGVESVLQTLTRLLRENGLDEAVELKGMFCGQNCHQAIFMRLEDHPFGHIRPQNVERVFHTEIRPRLKAA